MRAHLNTTYVLHAVLTTCALTNTLFFYLSFCYSIYLSLCTHLLCFISPHVSQQFLMYLPLSPCIFLFRLNLYIFYLLTFTSPLLSLSLPLSLFLPLLDKVKQQKQYRQLGLSPQSLSPLSSFPLSLSLKNFDIFSTVVHC